MPLNFEGAPALPPVGPTLYAYKGRSARRTLGYPHI